MEPALTEIQQLTASPLIPYVKRAFAQAFAGEGTLDPGVLTMDGMSGRKYRLFINNLIKTIPNPRYLEVGSWAGSTLCSAINGNAVTAAAIENWSQFGGPRDAFVANLAAFRSSSSEVRVLEQDFRTVDYTSIGAFNVFMYDGPHSPEDQYDGIALARPALDAEFVLIVDDWNWQEVRLGTARAIEQLDLSMEYSLEIRSSLDNSHPEVGFQHSDWHNGYFISVVRQPVAGQAG